MNGKAPSEFPKHVRSAMEYGTANEQNAVATIVGKILPVIHPNVTFFEVGCYVLHDGGNPFMVVNPDGAGQNDVNAKSSFAFEIKCPVPGKLFTTNQHYTIPQYYIPQLLAEMKALNSDKLYYVC